VTYVEEPYFELKIHQLNDYLFLTDISYAKCNANWKIINWQNTIKSRSL